MKGRVIAVLLGVAAGAASAAEPTGKQLFQQGAGEVPPCAQCHGPAAAGDAAGPFPALYGQPAAYLAKQLADFRSGVRQNDIMAPIAQQLTQAQIDQVTRYAAALPAPALASAAARAAAPAAAPADAGQRLALLGAWERGVPPCETCHGPAGQGVPPHFPALAGQHAEYILAALEAFRAGTRHNDPLGLMKHTADQLTPDESQAVARYFQSLRRAK